MAGTAIPPICSILIRGGCARNTRVAMLEFWHSKFGMREVSSLPRCYSRADVWQRILDTTMRMLFHFLCVGQLPSLALAHFTERNQSWIFDMSNSIPRREALRCRCFLPRQSSAHLFPILLVSKSRLTFHNCLAQRPCHPRVCMLVRCSPLPNPDCREHFLAERERDIFLVNESSPHGKSQLQFNSTIAISPGAIMLKEVDKS